MEPIKVVPNLCSLRMTLIHNPSTRNKYILENAIALWREPEQFSLYEVEFATDIVSTVMTILSYTQYSELPL